MLYLFCMLILCVQTLYFLQVHELLLLLLLLEVEEELLLLLLLLLLEVEKLALPPIQNPYHAVPSIVTTWRQ